MVPFLIGDGGPGGTAKPGKVVPIQTGASKAAQKIQSLIAQKADPVHIKGAYGKLFNAVVAEPCQETGTYKLRFVIGDGEIKNPVPFGGQGSVMRRLVRQRGLEPPRPCGR